MEARQEPEGCRFNTWIFFFQGKDNRNLKPFPAIQSSGSETQRSRCHSFMSQKPHQEMSHHRSEDLNSSRNPEGLWESVSRAGPRERPWMQPSRANKHLAKSGWQSAGHSRAVPGPAEGILCQGGHPQLPRCPCQGKLSLRSPSRSNSCSADRLLLLRKAELGSCHAHRAVWMGQGTVCV